MKDRKTSRITVVNLLEWYESFLKQYETIIQYKFSPTIVSEKYVKLMDKKNDHKQVNKHLIESIEDLKYDKVKQMLESGANIECYDNLREKRKPAHIACRKGDLKMVQLLHQFGCQWDSLDWEE